ncbi:TIGR03620 family F420-dependent LLM class oxidoreductase [Umezawaea sp. Da 62-37]|uniref:TIGR03620 family F420-dependent LLM class oxidoreductase n=1 Tax=Umezawaea sp. Da 62-37 TaxID=3075927 RepID=UPI0028F74B08|nr:TIGR03620 family F420-dependent LLM class oxidoreductase [Umezawaea sp. Da 62-37]WNV86847.1 TIGR03620 family F420-dependent LLM class oxidoreductase [Umezawaea sp. Da 62-37]
MNGERLDLGRVGVWSNDLDGLPIAQALRAAVELEESGCPTLWLSETTGREAFTQAALVLGATRRMTVATGVATIYGRDPVTAAQAQRTLTEAHPGRFVLGLGVSHPMFVEDVRGAVFGKRVPTMRSYLDRMDVAPFGPPGADKRPPRLLGAVGPGMLALAAERADGALPFCVPVEHTRRTRELMGPGAFLAVQQAVVLTADHGHARAIGRSYVAAGLPNRARVLADLGFEVDPGGPAFDRLVDALVAWGGPDEIGARVREHLDAGADHVCLHVLDVPPGSAPLSRWRALAPLFGSVDSHGTGAR